MALLIELNRRGKLHFNNEEWVILSALVLASIIGWIAARYMAPRSLFSMAAAGLIVWVCIVGAIALV